MRRTRLFALLLFLAALTGCAGQTAASGQTEGQTLLYFASQEEDGPALLSEPLETENGQPDVETLLRALLAGPQSEGLVSPFPAGTGLRNYHLEDGVLQIDLSENYGGLSGVNLTVADYCIVLTMCQLSQVDSVVILVDGKTPGSRSHQTLTAEEAMLFLSSQRE